jgi:hypothetical protein
MTQEMLTATQQRAIDGQLSCADAHAIAEQFGVSPGRIAGLVNGEADLRFYRCQLGLFGYGEKALGQSKIVLPAAHVPPEIEAALRERVQGNEITCLAVWEVAEQFAYPRLGMANIVEALDLRVRPCQLGCF